MKFYFLDEEDGINYLKVMDEISGKLLNKVEKVCNWILFDSNKNLLLINEELTYASPKGELIKNVKFVNFPHGAKNLWGFTDKLWCFDSKKFILAIKNY